MKIPTFKELLEEYPRIASMERMKSERPCKTTVSNNLFGVRKILELLGNDGASLDQPITWLTKNRIDRFLLRAAEKGMPALSSWTYVHRLRGVTARWTTSYYEALGWKVSPFKLPYCRKRLPRYERPDRSVLRKVKDWVVDLWEEEDRRKWLAATLMLEFGIRNGDVRRLTWANFRERDNGVCLCYTPHKTEQSSGRRVAWPVHPTIWTMLCEARSCVAKHQAYCRAGIPNRPHGITNSDPVVPGASYIFVLLNRELRANGIFKAQKGLYELRKVCIDHVYQRYGAEMASSLSGDDIRTVMRYYADPSQPNIGMTRIFDLL